MRRETGKEQVVQVVRRHDRILWKIKLLGEDDDGKFIATELETTDDHPWRSSAGAWKKTMELTPGTFVLLARGPPAKVISVQSTGQIKPTFNLEVADFHTYFAGEIRAWVHNSCSLETHHIVPQGDMRAADARANMEKHGINPKSDKSNQVNISAERHNVTKRDSYLRSANSTVASKSGESSIKNATRKIGKELQSKSLTYLNKKYPPKPR